MKNAIVIALLIWFAAYLHDGIQKRRQDITDERSCLQTAKVQSELDKCFAMMKLNNSRG